MKYTRQQKIKEFQDVIRKYKLCKPTKENAEKVLNWFDTNKREITTEDFDSLNLD